VTVGCYPGSTSDASCAAIFARAENFAMIPARRNRARADSAAPPLPGPETAEKGG
jgi:hypothetical protein